MFRNRLSARKPNDDLYKTFKASFPGMKLEEDCSDKQSDGGNSTNNARQSGGQDRQQSHQQSFQQSSDPAKDGEPTPRFHHADAWNLGPSGLTPSLLDPNSNSFNAFANQLPGYYTPTPGGNTLFHSHHAGDLHTPGFSFGLGTPLSMPTSDATLTGGQHAMSMASVQSHQLTAMQRNPMPQLQHFHGMDPFQMHHQQEPFASHGYQDFQPPSMQHADTQSTDSPDLRDVTMDMGVDLSSEQLFHPDAFNQSSEAPFGMPHSFTESFRYHTTLNAPTAMVKSHDEIPITYLNKGQTYNLNVVDNAPQNSAVGQLKYRTFVRVSFEDPEQRRRPAACWQLWKEGRGTNEAHHRGGRLQAVEYVDPHQNNIGTEANRPTMELECSSFDGFCVVWSPASSSQTECAIPVRFNFLSTDFSHSKGVKGIPVRLCAKTELLLDSMSPSSMQAPAHEICFCKVKLFRDHGAERKLSNDVAHVKKSIEKVNTQISQMEAGIKDSGKRKRSSVGQQDSQRPGKIIKHRRAWSMSSGNSPDGKFSPEDELHNKLAALQEMFSSTRTFSILFLKGTSEDDPDLHPVKLTGNPPDLTKAESGESATWEKQSMESSAMVSPTPSNHSMLSGGRHDSGFQNVAPVARIPLNDWRQHEMPTVDFRAGNPQQLASPPDQPVKIQTIGSSATGELPGWIDSVGTDPSYRPPPERVIKPAACFYVQAKTAGQPSQHDFYTAVYPMQRTLKDFNTALCLKTNMEPSQVQRIIRISKAGIQILLDDADVVELAESQDMKAVFHPLGKVDKTAKSTRQWDSGATDIQVDGEPAAIHDHSESGYELRLFF